MNEQYREAFSEVDQIIKLMPETLSSKIPYGFKNIISSEKSNRYIPNITEPIENASLKQETLILLSVIYRDFLCNDEEKERLKFKDSQKIKEYEETLREKYNPDNIFKNKKELSYIDNNVENPNTSMIEIKEESFLKRLFNKIKTMFVRK